MWAAVYHSDATEIVPQAVAAPDYLRARFGEEEKMQKGNWNSPQKKNENAAFIKGLEGKLMLFSFVKACRA